MPGLLCTTRCWGKQGWVVVWVLLTSGSLQTSPWETWNAFYKTRSEIKILPAFSSSFIENGAARINNTSLSFVHSKHCMLHWAAQTTLDLSWQFGTYLFFFLELTLKKTIPNSELATEFNYTYFVHFQKRRVTKIAILKWKIIWTVLGIGFKSRQM